MVDKQRVVELYAQGLSAIKVGEQVGCKSAQVYRILEHAGVKRRSTGQPGPHPWQVGFRHSEETKRTIGMKNRRPGSKLCDMAGYVLVNLPDHPDANSNRRVREHRLVMERILGRRILPSEVVHHKDGNKGNNAPENLQVMTKLEHVHHHAAKNRKVPVEIAKLVRAGELKKGEMVILAAQLGISHATLSHIKSGKTWKHL